MTISQALTYGTQKLSRSKSTSPELDAEVLLAFVLNKSKEYLFTNPEQTLLRNLVRNYSKLVNKRIKGWPVAYLTGYKEFFGLVFAVNKNVLIPRPETEQLVELALKKIQGQQLKILDIGTGSGCIVISLAKNAPENKYYASDISKQALATAKTNAKKHKVKVQFKLGGLLKPWPAKKFDVIVANLPYLAYETDPSTKFEPKLALIAKRNGLALFEEFFKQITHQPQYLFLEIGYDQAAPLTKLIHKYMPGYVIKIHKDLAGKNRVLEITKTQP